MAAPLTADWNTVRLTRDASRTHITVTVPGLAHPAGRYGQFVHVIAGVGSPRAGRPMGQGLWEGVDATGDELQVTVDGPVNPPRIKAGINSALERASRWVVQEEARRAALAEHARSRHEHDQETLEELARQFRES